MLGFTSCEEDPLVYEGDNFVSLDLGGTSLISLEEGGESTTITVIMAFARSTDTKVTLGFSDATNAVEDLQFALDTKEVVIKAGEYSATFTITPLDNDTDYLVDQQVEVEIASVDASDVQVALASGRDGSVVFSLKDNDIPPIPSLDYLYGDYTATAIDITDAELPQTNHAVSISAHETDTDKVMINNILDFGSSIEATVDMKKREMTISLGQLLFVSSQYGDVLLYGYNGEFQPTGDIVVSVDLEGNIAVDYALSPYVPGLGYFGVWEITTIDR